MNNIEYILNELLKSNISVLTQQVFQELSNTALYLLNIKNHNEEQIQQMKSLLMICNILYNRSDMLVLPVEDGVYDLLLELYKKYDPHFQVGSQVVQFRSQMEKDHPEIKEIICPITFLPKVNRDEMRQEIYEKLSSFDQDKFSYKDYIPDIEMNQEAISKRTHDTAHHHPDLVGTLDKCKFVLDSEAIALGVYNDPNVKILERDFFQKHIAAGIINPNDDIEMVLELKYDGISIEADCTDMVLSARSRGDTNAGVAADMTPILYGYKFPHNQYTGNEVLGVKFEAIMTKTDLQRFNQLKDTSYANCRTAIIGLFGSSDGYKYKNLITLVPLAIDNPKYYGINNRIEEIEFGNRVFKKHGEVLRYMYIHGNVTELLYQIKKFAEEAYAFRDFVDFMFDGIVVSYLDENIRQKLGRENYINKYSMAVKFNPESKLTYFTGYTYEVGQDGRICPMIHYNPVEFFGTIHTKSTGSSLARFKQLGLKLGDMIKVTYVNDVMPYVESVDCVHNRNNQEPLCEFPTICPDCGTPLIISDSGKTAICPNFNCNSKIVVRITNMLQKMNIKGFADSTIRSLGIKSFYELMQLEYDQVSNIIGPGNAANLMEAINQIKTGYISDYIVIGSLGITGCAANTWKLIFSQMSLKEFVSSIENSPDMMIAVLSNIKGIGPKTASVIVNEYPYFQRDIHYILDHTNYTDSAIIISNMKQIRFSGIRDLQLAQQLCNFGFDADGNAGVTKNTDVLIIPYAGFNSTKVSKVGPNCKIIPIDQVRNLINNALLIPNKEEAINLIYQNIL